jgi:hypothetical protein
MILGRGYGRLAAAVLGCLLGIGLATAVAAQKRDTAPPAVEGNWSGTWGIAGRDTSMALDCTVTRLGKDRWQAIFSGECGRPYRYTVRMAGRRVGDVVLFKGTADLGEQDGGVYDWIGRASEKEFLGFYTSQGYTGSFKLTRLKETATPSP